MSFSQLISLLLASNNSNKVPIAIETLRTFSLEIDQETKRSNLYLLRYGDRYYKDAQMRVFKKLKQEFNPLIESLNKK